MYVCVRICSLPSSLGGTEYYSSVHSEIAYIITIIVRAKTTQLFYSHKRSPYPPLITLIPNMAQETANFFELPPEIRNMVYKYLYTNDCEGDLASKVLPATLQTCRQFYQEAVPIMSSLITFDLTVQRDGVKYCNGPILKSPLTPPSRIQNLRLTIISHPTGVEGEVDLNINIELVEIQLRAIVLALMRGRHLLSTLQIHITDYFGTLLGAPTLVLLMNGLVELHVKDEIVIVTPETPGLMTLPGHRFMEGLKKRVHLQGSANEEMWSKQETLGMCFDMWMHTNSYRNFICRWTTAVGGGLKRETKRRLYLAFPYRMLPFSLSNVDGLALPVGFDHEAELRKAVSVVLKIDKLIDLNIDNLHPSLVDRFWPYPDGVKSYISMLRKRLYMRPAFQEIIRPLDHSPDYSLEPLQDKACT